jgi:hypothetical protein
MLVLAYARCAGVTVRRGQVDYGEYGPYYSSEARKTAEMACQTDFEDVTVPVPTGRKRQIYSRLYHPLPRHPGLANRYALR